MNNNSGKKKQLLGRQKGWGLCIIFVVVLFILFCLGLCGTVGLGLVVVTKKELNIKRYSLEMTGSKLFEDGAGDTNGYGFGHLTIDTNDNRVSYNIIFARIGEPDALHIHGPITLANPLTASVAIPNDGTSLSVTVVDDAMIQGSIYISHSLAIDIINNPTHYYISLKTDDKPTGSIGTRLGNEFSKEY